MKGQCRRHSFASIAPDNANECRKIGTTLWTIVFRSHPASAMKERYLEDGSAKGDVEGVAHERMSGKWGRAISASPPEN